MMKSTFVRNKGFAIVSIATCLLGLALASFGFYSLGNQKSGDTSGHVTHIGGSNGSVTVVTSSNIDWGGYIMAFCGMIAFIGGLIFFIIYQSSSKEAVIANDSELILKKRGNNKTIRYADVDSCTGDNKNKILTISTSGEKFKFFFIENSEELGAFINKKKNELNSKEQKGYINEQKSDYIEELRRLDELVKDCILTKEEFETKKKILLNDKEEH